MARTVRDQECVFCGESPCNCDPKKVRKTTKKKASRESEPKTSAPKFATTRRERDFTMEAAIRAVGPLLSRQDRLVHKQILGSHLGDGVERRLKDWREKNDIR